MKFRHYLYQKLLNDNFRFSQWEYVQNNDIPV